MSAGARLLAQPDRLAPDLAGLAPDRAIDVIIQLEEAPGEDTPSARPSAPRSKLPQHLGGVNLAANRPVRELGLIHGVAVRLPVGALASIARDPRVKYISPDREITGNLQNAIPAVGADVAQKSGFDGRGIGIAIIDSGINTHPDLMDDACRISRIVYRQNFAPPDQGAEKIDLRALPDLSGHGTHVAGIAAGNGRCSPENQGKAIVAKVHSPNVRFVGVAPRASLIDLRVLNNVGTGTDSGAIQAIERAIQLRKQFNIRVINLSLGRRVLETYKKDPLCQAVERAWRAGITVVVAAGNLGRVETVRDSKGNEYRINGYGTIGSPGIDPFVITVGAMRDMNTPERSDDLMASFSSKGPTGIDRFIKPDLVAPGNRLYSAYLMGSQFGDLLAENRTRIFESNGTVGIGNFLHLSGTSMASPMVAGTAALLAQQLGLAYTPDSAKAKLMKSASKSFSVLSTFQTQTIVYDVFTVGAGYLDIPAALNNGDIAATGRPALSPSILDTCNLSKNRSMGGIGCVKISHSPSSLFGGTAPGPWSNQSVWGRNLILSDGSLWGFNGVWSDPLMSGYSLLWGDSVLWGDSLLWGDSVLWGDNTQPGQQNGGPSSILGLGDQ